MHTPGDCECDGREVVVQLTRRVALAEVEHLMRHGILSAGIQGVEQRRAIAEVADNAGWQAAGRRQPRVSLGHVHLDGA